MGNLFYRKQSIAVISELNYHELKYWNNWHKLIASQEKKELDGV